MSIVAPLGTGTVLPGTKPVKQKKHAAKATQSAFPPSLTQHRAPVANLPHDLQPAMIVLATVYEDAITKEYSDAVAILCGAAALIKHHPGLRDYHQALFWINSGDKLLNKLYARVGVNAEAARGQPSTLVRISHLYETAMGAGFEDAVNELSGTRDLIAHHPDLRNYHRALGWIVAGHNMMLDFCQQVHAL